MKRRVMVVGCSALVAVSFAVSGCGGGGIEEGMPKDTKQSVDMNRSRQI